MLIEGNNITMTDHEWESFRIMTRAQSVPKTIEEFNTMCDIAAQQKCDEDPINGPMWMMGTLAMKFSPDNTPNFPLNSARNMCMRDTRAAGIDKPDGWRPTEAEVAEYLEKKKQEAEPSPNVIEFKPRTAQPTAS